MNHVGVSVVDLDRSIEFYRDVLGMEVVAQGAFSGEQYEAILGLKGAVGRAALLKRANFQIELFEFRSPTPRRTGLARPVCDHGISHFCLEVTDIKSEYDRLAAAGVTFHCAPLKFIGIAMATYGRDPDGNVFELLEKSEGRSPDRSITA